MWLDLILIIAMLICAVMAIRAQPLLTTVLWLASLSALCAVLLYLLGAHEVAVIELSVGAGLVTVLFVFAIGIAGDMTRDLPSLTPAWLAWLLSAALFGLLARLVWMAGDAVLRPPAPTPATSSVASYANTLWTLRSLDMIVAVALIFTGVLGMLNLLRAGKSDEESDAQSPMLVRDRGRSTLATAPAVAANHRNGDKGAVIPKPTPHEEKA